MKIIIVQANHLAQKSFTASVFKTDGLNYHAKSEVEALEGLIKKIKNRDDKYILSNPKPNTRNITTLQDEYNPVADEMLSS